jgi:hypothetical protein
MPFSKVDPIMDPKDEDFKAISAMDSDIQALCMATLLLYFDFIIANLNF